MVVLVLVAEGMPVSVEFLLVWRGSCHGGGERSMALDTLILRWYQKCQGGWHFTSPKESSTPETRANTEGKN